MTKPVRLILTYVVSMVVALLLTYCTNEQLQGMELLKKSFLNFVAIRFCISITNLILKEDQ